VGLSIEYPVDLSVYTESDCTEKLGEGLRPYEKSDKIVLKKLGDCSRELLELYKNGVTSGKKIDTVDRSAVDCSVLKALFVLTRCPEQTMHLFFKSYWGSRLTSRSKSSDYVQKTMNSAWTSIKPQSEFDAPVLEQLAQGHTYRDVSVSRGGREKKLSHVSVVQVVKRENARRASLGQKTFSESYKEKKEEKKALRDARVVELKLSGKTNREIIAETGLSQSHITKTMKLFAERVTETPLETHRETETLEMDNQSPQCEVTQ
jgi:hypothetical protein